MKKREDVARKVKALRQKTRENGCTEAEALAAAELAAKLILEYRLEESEIDVQDEPVKDGFWTEPAEVGMKLHNVAMAIAKLTGTRTVRSPEGTTRTISHFFGLAHEVEIACHLMSICSRATHDGLTTLAEWHKLKVEHRKREDRRSYVNGITERLAERIYAMVPQVEEATGTGLIILRHELILRKLPKLREGNGRQGGSMGGNSQYARGRADADRVALNRGLGSDRDSNAKRIT